jgi:hypothetical protein
MNKKLLHFAKVVEAKHLLALPDVGGGAFGMARLARILQSRLAPSAGKRPGRLTNRTWTKHPKVPMSAETLAALEELSAQFSTDKRTISPMQVAAQLLEESVVQLSVAPRKRLRRKAT